MPRRWLLVLSAVMVFHTDVLTQERGIELQGGAGYVLDPGEGPSVPAVIFGVVAWITRGWGMGVRLVEGMGNDYRDAPRDTFLGLGDLRIFTLTSQWRWFARGTEVNFGFGLGGQGYRYHYMQAGERIDMRSGSAIIPIDLLVRRHLTGRLHVKGGFTYGLAGDSHPFQPVVVFAWKP
jgi:hypothetical protein